MKRAILAAMAVLMMAGAAYADEATEGGRTKCTWQARQIWPVAQFLTLGAWPGPESAKSEFRTTSRPGDAVAQFGKEADQELKGAPGHFVGVIECEDGEIMAQARLQN